MRPLPLASATASLLLIAVAAWSFVGGVVARVGRTAWAVSRGGVTYRSTDLPVIDHYDVTWLSSDDDPIDAPTIAAEHRAPFEFRFAGLAFARFDVTDPRDLAIRATAPEGHKPSLSTDTVLIIPLWPLVLLTAWPPVRAWRRGRYRAPGTCPACGYDLRATPGRCPECGLATRSTHSPPAQ